MKNGWQTQTLTSLTEKITDGSHNPPKGVAESDFLMLSSKNVFDDDFHYDAPRYLSAEQFHQEDKRTGIRPNDVLLTIVGTIGRCAVVPTDAPKITLQRSVAVIRPRSESIVPRFLMYSFIERNADLNEQARGVAQKGIYLETLRELRVKFPPLPEQQRIVGILDEAFDGIATAKANAEKNLQNARALFESHLNAVFTQRGDGWEEKRIPDVCLTFGRGKSRHRPRNEPSLYGGDYPFIQTGDLNNADHVVTTHTQTYSEKGLAQSKLWPKGTVGIAIVGATIGETGVLGFNGCFPDSVIGMTADPARSDPFFIEYMLQHFKDTVKSQGEGSARHNINLGTFDRLHFPMPSVTVQQHIVEKTDALKSETRHLESIYQRKLAALDELKKSLLHQAFSGAL